MIVWGPVEKAVMLIGAWLGLLMIGYDVGETVTNVQLGLDTSLITTLHGPEHGPVTSAMRLVTSLGSPLVLDIVFALALAMLLARRRWPDLIFLMLASPGTVLMVQILKHEVDRVRPAIHHLTAAGGGSWPSGHASGSMALYGSLLILGRRHHATPDRDPHGYLRVATAGVTALLTLIGLSRVVLGVHYPTDVIGSWILVAVWLSAVDRLRFAPTW